MMIFVSTPIMYQHAVGDEVGVEVLDVEVVDEDRLVQLLQLQPRHNPRVAGDRLDAVSHGQVARRNPALAHYVERVAGRRVDDAPARLDVQKLAVLPDEDLLDLLQRPLAGLDVVRPHAVPRPDLVDAPEARLRSYRRVPVETAQEQRDDIQRDIQTGLWVYTEHLFEVLLNSAVSGKILSNMFPNTFPRFYKHLLHFLVAFIFSRKS